MALADHFRPKWRHSDPDIRVAAVKKLEDPELLALVASDDGNFRVRLEALQKIRDKDILSRIAMGDENSLVRLAAVRLLEDPLVLSRVVARDTAQKVRLEALEKIQRPDILQSISCCNHNSHVRLAAIRKIEDQDILADIVRRSHCPSTRQAALRKIHNLRVLTDIAINGTHVENRLSAAETISASPEPKGITRIKALSLPFISVDKDQDMKLIAKSFRVLEKLMEPDALACIATSSAHYLVRWEAISLLRDPGTLRKIAVACDIPRLRQAAAARLRDPSHLFGIATSDEDWRVRATAASRLRDIASLLVICENDPDIRVRLAAISRIGNRDLLRHVQRTNTEKALRLAAQARLEARPFVSEMLRVYISCFLGNKKNPSRSIPPTNLSLSEIFRVPDPLVLGLLAPLDGSEGLDAIRHADSEQHLSLIASTAEDFLVRLLAISRINRPSLLLGVIAQCGGRSLYSRGVRSSRCDFARWAALEKLGARFLLPWAGFDTDYVAKLLNEPVLMSLMASETFPALSAIARERYEALVTMGSRYHVPFGDHNMYEKAGY